MYHLFADDTQFYTSVYPDQIAKASKSLSDCMNDVLNWCGARKLQLNADKTETTWFGSHSNMKNYPIRIIVYQSAMKL